MQVTVTARPSTVLANGPHGLPTLPVVTSGLAVLDELLPHLVAQVAGAGAHE